MTHLWCWRAGVCGERDTIKFNAAFSACEKALVGERLRAMKLSAAVAAATVAETAEAACGRGMQAADSLAVLADGSLEYTITYSAVMEQGNVWLRAFELLNDLAGVRVEQDSVCEQATSITYSSADST